MNHATRLMYATDAYKVNHINMYPENVAFIHSVLTARNGKHSNVPTEGVVLVGVTDLTKNIRSMAEDFFAMTYEELTEAKQEYAQFFSKFFQIPHDKVRVDHWQALWNLQELPIKIGSQWDNHLYPYQTPLLTIENTHKSFAWLVNYLESYISAEMWMPCTSATTAHALHELVSGYSTDTCDNNNHLAWQCHDFSFRGMPGAAAAVSSSKAHLQFFSGTDNVLAAADMGANWSGSVPATEHSIMVIAGEDGEYAELERLIDLYPTGIVSLVCDTYDYWRVIHEYLPKLKPKIMAREGKVVIRPDSGNPVDIVRETIPALYEIFGGTVNKKGFKELDSHIGIIYGDGMTYAVIDEILGKLKLDGFASNTIVFGVGSYTYTYVTRDTHSFAIKATWCKFADGTEKNLIKNPKTDPDKKSLTGRFELPCMKGWV